MSKEYQRNEAWMSYLPDARSASVRKDEATNVLKNVGNLVALHGRTNLFGAGSAEEGNLGLQAGFLRLPREVCHACLIRHEHRTTRTEYSIPTMS